MLGVLTPFLATGLLCAVWDLPRPGFGWAFMLTSALARAAGWAVDRTDAGKGHGEAQRFTSVSLATVALALLLMNEWLYAALGAEVVLLHFAAQRREAKWLLALGIFLGSLVGVWYAERLDSAGTLHGGDWTTLLDLGVLAVAVLSARTVYDRDRRLYLFLAYVGMLLWIWRELLPLPQGQVLISLVWGAVGATVVVLGLAKARRRLRALGLGTLAVVVAKLFLVDLSQVAAISRIVLFLAFGALFLVLSRLYGRAVGPRSVTPPATD